MRGDMQSSKDDGANGAAESGGNDKAIGGDGNVGGGESSVKGSAGCSASSDGDNYSAKDFCAKEP